MKRTFKEIITSIDIQMRGLDNIGDVLDWIQKGKGIKITNGLFTREIPGQLSDKEKYDALIDFIENTLPKNIYKIKISWE